MHYFLQSLLMAAMLLSVFQLSGQNSSNMTLLYQYDDASITSYNDIWGYSDNGTEVAILGTRDSILFFDVTNPSQVVKLTGIKPGASSSWRDMKTYQHYCYGVTEGNEGLTIININDILAGTATYQVISTDFARAHNVWVDTEKSKLYVVGSNPSISNDGLIIYDLQPDPYNPTLLAQFNFSDFGINCNGSTDTYVHDLFVRNDTAYCNMESDCGFYVFDVSNPDTPVYLGDIPPGGFQSGYNHSCWVSDDGNTAVVAEESYGRPVHFVDISNLSTMTVIGSYKDPLDPNYNNNIAHNPFIKDNFCYISYYHDGVVILDISNPTNPVRVGYYDTDTNHTDYSGFRGVWGVYPFLPSGNVLASDMNNGLFVFDASSALLPIDWIRFEAFEKGNDRFSIQAQFQSTEDLEKAELYWSLDGRDFEKWADLDYEKDNVQQYTIDEELDRPTSNGFYVQIKTTEIDGYESRSVIRRLPEVDVTGLEVYPNPATDMLYISQEKDTHMDMLSLEGKKVLSLKLQKGLNEVPLPGSILKGTYILRFTDSLDKTQYSSTVQILR